MLVWRDIGFRKNETGHDPKIVGELANSYARRIGQLPNSGNPYDTSSIASSIIETYEKFLKATKTILRWDDVPKDKQRLDHEQFMRAMFLGYKKPFYSTTEEIDQETDRFSGKTLENDKGLSFYHSIECVVGFCENVSFSKEEAVVFLQELFGCKALYDPLYIKEMLNHPERLGFREKSREPEKLAQAISENYERLVSYNRNELPKIADEKAIAKEFFAQREREGAFLGKFVVHSIDTQASAKAWRTYEQFAALTSSKLASIAIYGLVPGGVLGGINPTEIYGTLDRADLMIMNWYPRFQGGVIIPTEFFAQQGFGCEFTGSMSVMIDGDRGTGRDIITKPNEEGILPYLSPSEFVVIVPTELQRATVDKITSLYHKLLRPPEEIATTLKRCIGYEPKLWKNFHYFNEWLQTTPEGNALLEERIGCPVSDLKLSDEIKANIRDGRLSIR
ncbi:hypothetical protein HZB88_00445 [archaeon]|nr:hypothetical protein [archaeon]